MDYPYACFANANDTLFDDSEPFDWDSICKPIEITDVTNSAIIKTRVQAKTDANTNSAITHEPIVDTDALDNATAFDMIPSVYLFDVRLSYTQTATIAIMINITELHLTNCNLTTLEWFSSLAKLKQADVSCNQLTNLKGLPMHGLTSLAANNNQLANLNNINTASHLNNLDLACNDIDDLAPLAAIAPNLMHLDVSSNNLTSFNGVSLMFNLETFKALYNPITDATELDYCCITSLLI